MKKITTLLVVIVFSIAASNCGRKMTVCECLKDDGSHKADCDRLGESMSSDEIRREMAKCR